MGSDYQFPQALSSSNVREPSFSLYLNGDDRCRGLKLAELTQSRSGQNERDSVDGEISVFSADKYFSEVVEDGCQSKESGLRRFDVERNQNNMAAGFSPVRSKVSLGTPSIRSESSWNSQSGLLHSVPTQVPGRRYNGETQKKKSLLSSFSCKCSCANKKSLKVDDQHHKRVALKEPVRAGTNRADQLLEDSATLARKPWMAESKVTLCPAKPSLLNKGPVAPPSLLSSVAENPSQKIQKNNTDSIASVPIPSSFDLPAVGKTRNPMGHEKISNLVKWDNFSLQPEDVYIPSAISVEYFTDAESDTSADLFEIDSFTGHRKPSFSGQIPDSNASGNATPTTCYAPSAASVGWSVITASAVDFSTFSECEEFKPEMPETNIQNNRDTE